MMNIIYAIGIWICILILWSGTDAGLNDKGKPILLKNHLAAWILRYIMGFLIVKYVWYYGDPPYFWKSIFTLLFMGGLSWWIFDLFYNLARNNPQRKWNEVGESSWLDKWFHRFKDPFIAQAIVKSIILLGGLAGILFT